MISFHVLEPQMLSAKTFPVKLGQIMREQKHKQGTEQEVETLAERNQRTKCPIVFRYYLILLPHLVQERMGKFYKSFRLQNTVFEMTIFC